MRFSVETTKVPETYNVELFRRCKMKENINKDFCTYAPIECQRSRILWQSTNQQNSSLLLSLRVLDNCLVVIQAEMQDEIVYQLRIWGQPCDPEASGIPSLGIRRDSHIELRNKTGLAARVNGKDLSQWY